MQRHFDIVLLGGGQASVSAAETLRAEGATGTILLISGEDCSPYGHTYLSKQVLLGPQPDKSLLIHGEAYYRENAIDLMLGTRATGIDTANRLVHTDRSGDIHFGKLLIATGTRPNRLAVPGAELDGIHYLHTSSDASTLRLAAAGIKRVAVIGGSFLGIEIATTLARLGISVVLLEQKDSLLSQLEAPELSGFFTRHCESRGIEVRTGDAVTGFLGTSHVEALLTQSGEALPCDLAVVAIGVSPATEFLRGTNITVDDGIVVSEHLETNVPGIFAAGDVASFYDIVFKAQRRVEHWDNAVKQGRLAARNMMGQRLAYEEVSYFFCNILDLSFNFLGSVKATHERISRGSLEDGSFALLYIEKDVLRACFSMGRPASETLAAELLIRHRTNLGAIKGRLADAQFPLDSIPSQTVLILQGGGALGAFECGVMKALDEAAIRPDVIAGVSIGAFNGAIIASNPGNASAALEGFWNELALTTPCAPTESWRRSLSAWWAIWLGSPRFFLPNWLQPWLPPPWQWTSLYDTTPARALLEKYVSFSKLKDSPVRLFVSTVNVETATLEVFDSFVDDLTVDHILASGSLPPAFPWTTIRESHYWDAGIVSNSPLEFINERCGEISKRVFIVDLFPNNQRLPGNLAEVLLRRDEIVYAERVRNELRVRERIGDLRNLVAEIMENVEPETCERLRQRPSFIRLMGDAAPTVITRIVNHGKQGEPLFLDNDFSWQTVERHKKSGYETAKRTLGET
ncbi:FAD-dependent oxidoreductase [Cupriavidus sp. WKF15]|uniref:FAD-dependent oxidoreductase n=1 Tax=Cupriavidus sp. WKF15 TaxID=3032282 RepID=UPI0023E17B67|nr:FAD-dependent oxidoreductase [Cupriavidus sp. WKF15]WER50270.1 FAD-dependent oxidoreductase [Cupriavidus sp. WKF15]